MRPVRLVGTRARRVLVVSLLLLAAFTFVALPAAGQPPQSPTATVSFTDNGNCTATVEYTWSGFRGSGFMAEYGVRWPGDGGIHFALVIHRLPRYGKRNVFAHVRSRRSRHEHLLGLWLADQQAGEDPQRLGCLVALRRRLELLAPQVLVG